MLDLIVKSETEGLEPDEAVTLAAWYINTGMVNSTGSIGRFVNDIASVFPVELEEALS
jgi:hypothetical protein